MNWKEAPADPRKRWLNKSIEIQVMLACNWSCTACDQFSQLHGVSFVKKGTMTVAQINHFCDEMIDHNAYIGRVRLVGGEPSLHPKLPEIVRIIRERLVNAGHIGRIELVTNGSHPEKLQGLGLRVRTSDEADKQKHHTANLVRTPLSMGYEGKPCSAPWHCGISLNYWGYFPCSSGAGIARFVDEMPRWQRLELPSCEKPCNAVRETWPDLADLCGQCYHALKPEHKIKCGTGQQPGQHELNAPNAEAWGHLAKWITGKSPDWAIYGQTAVPPSLEMGTQLVGAG